MEGGHSLLESMLCDEDAEPTDLPISLLKSITNDFADAQQIGCGGFAVVYKGLLENGAVVAVKKLSNSISMDENRYIQEVRCLMRVKHRNIVRFLGYCANTQGKMLDFGGRFVMADVRERLLCFEFVPNGTLKDYITDASSGLEWRKRYQIIKGICEGLHYLHEMRIVHLDLKPSNILLDDDMVPKIADFGISRFFDQGQSWVTATKLAGTPGYLAPKAYTRKITFKLDMYSVGVIIIETLTGQKGYSSVENVLESWRNRLKTSSAMDTVLGQIRVCFEISMDCMEFNPEKRPMTKRIIELLKQTECSDEFSETDVQMPHAKLEFLEARQNGGVTISKQGSATAFNDDEKPPISNAVDMGSIKVGMSRQSSDVSHKRNSTEQPPSKDLSLERRWSLEAATEKFIGHESSESSGLESLEDLSDSRLPILEGEYMQGVLTSEVVLDKSFSDSSKKAKRRQKKVVRDIKKPGETIIKGHRSYGLMLSLQLGIRYTVGKIAPLQKREVCASDFGPKASFWMNFPKEGSQLTPPHSAEDFKWKDYCPTVSDYMTPICGKSALRELSSPGKSGSVFFLSQDDRFMIKRLRKSEVQVLLRMLPNYYNHIHIYENTLITKFFGLHSMKPSSGQKFRFVVMGNMFCTELRIHRRFELKGSSLGRCTDEIEIDENTTLKDLDLNYSFYLEPPWREALLKQIETDSRFLRTQRIMDYSLLLGVHYRPPQHLRRHASCRRSMAAEEDAKEDDALNYPEGLVQSSGENSVVLGPHMRGSRLRASAAGFGEVDLLLPGTARLQIQLGVNMPATAEHIPKDEESEPFREVYDVVLYLGIIDILQEYNMTKKIEHAVKSMQYDSASITAVDPQFYSERFLKFITTVFP